MSLEEAIKEHNKKTVETIIPNIFISANMTLVGVVYCLCPITKAPDRFTFRIEITPGKSKEYPEMVSFERFLETFKDEELGIEDTCGKLFVELDAKLNPNRLYVKIENSDFGHYFKPTIEKLYEVDDKNRNY